MNPIEGVQLLRMLTGLLGLVAFVMLYALGGGIKRTLFRRILGSIVLCGTFTAVAFWSGKWSWWMLPAAPATFGWLTMGYGADNLPSKLRERALYGLVGGAISGVWLLPLGMWHVWLFQTILAVMASCFYGVVNPHSRVGEEGAISLFIVACPTFALV